MIKNLQRLAQPIARPFRAFADRFGPMTLAFVFYVAFLAAAFIYAVWSTHYGR